MTTPFYDDHLKEECGVFGIFKHTEAAAHTVLGLHALQHRGQESAGIVTTHNGEFHIHHSEGLVGDNFNSPNILAKLPGDAAIGHVRYSTSGGGGLRNVQPMFAQIMAGYMAIAHNGNLTNAEKLKTQLVAEGCIFSSTSDTEVIIHLMATSNADGFESRLIEALKQVEGAYSLQLLTKDALIGVRDSLGIRPLVLGKLADSYILASETCALDILGAQYVRDINPGELIIINAQGLTSLYPFVKQNQRFCIFEYIYFARPDSNLDGKNVYAVRKAIGKELARESHIEVDLIVPVPDSGVASALGYAEESGVAFELGIIRNHYVGRTFIEPTDHVRHLGVKLKHNANINLLRGKRVMLIDDSIVRGTTSKKIAAMVRDAGAKEVHMRIASPPTKYSCFYGVDTPEQDKLIASKMNVDEMKKLIGIDSLQFISIDGLYRAVGEAKRNDSSPAYCDACFTGDYPIKIS